MDLRFFGSRSRPATPILPVKAPKVHCPFLTFSHLFSPTTDESFCFEPFSIAVAFNTLLFRYLPQWLVILHFLFRDILIHMKLIFLGTCPGGPKRWDPRTSEEEGELNRGEPSQIFLLHFFI